MMGCGAGVALRDPHVHVLRKMCHGARVKIVRLGDNGEDAGEKSDVVGWGI